jgi:prophage regulatory protein
MATNTGEIVRWPGPRKYNGKGRSQTYADMAAGKFPKPIKLGGRAVGWLKSELEDWQKARIAERDAKAPRNA